MLGVLIGAYFIPFSNFKTVQSNPHPQYSLDWHFGCMSVWLPKSLLTVTPLQPDCHLYSFHYAVGMSAAPSHLFVSSQIFFLPWMMDATGSNTTSGCSWVLIVEENVIDVIALCISPCVSWWTYWSVWEWHFCKPIGTYNSYSLVSSDQHRLSSECPKHFYRHVSSVHLP